MGKPDFACAGSKAVSVRKRRSEAGFSLVELMIVVALVGILAAIAIPQYYDSIKKAKSVQCRTNRGSITRAAFNYIEKKNLRIGVPTPSIPDLMTDGVLTVEPVCRPNGVYFWIDTTVPESGLPEVGCSVHWVP